MYALMSHGDYADETDRETDGQTRHTDGCHTITLCFLLDAANIKHISVTYNRHNNRLIH